MSLQPVAVTTEAAAANQIAQRIVQEINQTSNRIAAINAALGKDNCDLLDSIKSALL
jgi:hypothetical protein